MRNERHDARCIGCGATISRRRRSRSGLCVECQKELRRKEKTKQPLPEPPKEG